MIQTVIPGEHLQIDFREVEYLIKCPLRHLFFRTNPLDTMFIAYRALDQTFAHASLRMVIGDTPKESALINMFHSKFEALINTYKVLDNETTEISKESSIRKGEELISYFSSSVRKFTDKFSIVHGPSEGQYTSSGVSIVVNSSICVKKKAEANTLKEPQYLIFDYSLAPSKNFNEYSRLWAALFTSYLKGRGISTLDVSIYSVKSATVRRVLPTKDGIAVHMLNSICSSLGANNIYPIFGKHCHSCIYQSTCARACTY